jgi:hypothetical protein
VREKYSVSRFQRFVEPAERTPGNEIDDHALDSTPDDTAWFQGELITYDVISHQVKQYRHFPDFFQSFNSNDTKAFVTSWKFIFFKYVFVFTLFKIVKITTVLKILNNPR